jgi:hypothetical protein
LKEKKGSQRRISQNVQARLSPTNCFLFEMFGFSKTQVVIGAALAAAGAVAIYRNVRNWTKPKQTTDQPLHVWVNNSDYDESFACDVLTACPRVVAVYLARAAFWPTLYWTGIKALVSKSNRWMDRIDENVILGTIFFLFFFFFFFFFFNIKVLCHAVVPRN